MIYKLPCNQGASEKEVGFLFPLDVFKWLCILTPAPPPTFLLSCSLSASWCNVRNSNHVRLWHWQPWHSQQRDTEEREEERLQRGEVRNSNQGRVFFFFFVHKIHSCKIANVLDLSHPRKIKERGKVNSDENGIGPGRFCATIFPLYFLDFIVYLIL